MADEMRLDLWNEVSQAIDRVWNVGASREQVIAAVTQLLAQNLDAERQRSVELCRSRAALWQRTPLAHSPVAAAREEARGRANEAAYLADLIESGSEAP